MMSLKPFANEQMDGCMGKVFEGVVRYELEDSGQAMIAQIDGEDDTMFIRIQSWDETRGHKDAREFDGKKVRVTLEVIND